VTGRRLGGSGLPAPNLSWKTCDDWFAVACHAFAFA
jgi:hypothetical protein